MSLVVNIKWIGISQAIKIISQIVAIFYLTRLISPDEYGLLSMTAIVMNLALIFSDMGTGAAIIQRQRITQSFYSLVYKINIVIGFSIMFVILILSPYISNYFQRIELINLFYALSIIFPILSFGIVHKAKLEKEQNFKTIAKIEVIANLFGLFLVFVLANLNFGVYSIILQTIFVALFGTIGFIRKSNIDINFEGGIDVKEVKHIVGFSGNLLSFNLINYFSRNLDVILIGKFFSSSILGIYSIAYKIMLFPVQSMTFVVSRALLPNISSNLSDIESIRDNYFNCILFISALTAPLMLGLSALSEDFVTLFFDPKWKIMSSIIMWLAPIAIIQAILSTTGSIMTAFNKTNWLFYLGCLSTFFYVSAFFIGINYDILTFVKLYFFANIINYFPVLFVVGGILNFNLIQSILVVLKALIPALVMYFFLLFINAIFDYINYLIFSLKVLLGFFVYFLTFLFLNFDIVKPFFKKVKGIRL